MIDEHDLSPEADRRGGVADADVGGAASLDRAEQPGVAEERVRVVAVRNRPAARVEHLDDRAVFLDADQVGEAP